MKPLKFATTIIILILCAQVQAQVNATVPGLSDGDSDIWMLHNREYIYENEVLHLSGQPGDGLLWNSDVNFSDGTIELDLKGKDERGRSFVGLAFHVENETTFDAIYFRPFNFKSPERKSHSVQYISSLDYGWQKLREEHPGVYENNITPAPEPEEWLHVKVVVEYPEVKVYVNNSDEPSLTVKQISKRKEGWIGFWVGNNSEGWFRNLKIITKP